ncbi:hypothetical protein EPJ74_03515 [Brachyspira aalborgi]|uniref:Bacterial bifunctional deaminase-reductase C-terminal domain-containing protein n=2 Tax=Brachyspira aalborgi TaxID=29522 RepID=A0A5C8GH75_9SPIR|nr:hypothetical protein EPJ74_03515 [Brachyspira aalborgi]
MVKERKMFKPYVSLLMLISIDGKIDGSFINDYNQELGDYYEELKLEISEAWGNGSSTHKIYFSDENAYISKYKNSKIDYEDNIVKSEFPYVVSFDTNGKVKWKDNLLIYPDNIKNQVLVVTTKKSSAEYIAYLKEKKIAYIFAGEEKIDLNIALDKLYRLFNIKKFAITGGATINAEFFRENLVDEIMIMIAPFIDGSKNATISETVDGKSLTKEFKFSEVKKLKNGGLLLIYKK